MATFRVKWLTRILSGLVAVIALFLAAAPFGSIIDANPYWKSTDGGVLLFIETNGLHTGIIMPVYSDVHDWRELIRPEHVEICIGFGSHILVGWGHEGVYLNTEYWQHLRFKYAASAIFGSDDVLLHVYHQNYPQADSHYLRPI